MHHWMSKPDWLEELNSDLHKLSAGKQPSIPFEDFVLVEEDWALGRQPEDVARTIWEGTHRRIHITINA